MLASFLAEALAIELNAFLRRLSNNSRLNNDLRPSADLRRLSGTRRALIECIRREEEMMAATVSESGFAPRIGRSVSLDHAAEILGVSRRTIYNRIRDGRLQTIRTLGGSQRVLLDSVQDDRSQAADMPSRSHAL
jgi:excisionase family DNA binding protein